MKTKTFLTLTALFLSFGSFLSGDEEQKIREAMPSKPTTKPSKVRKALIYSHASGFKHSSIPTGAKALRIMSEKTGAFEATFTIKTDEFTKEGLAKYDLIIFNNCTHVQKPYGRHPAKSNIGIY